MQFLLIWLGIGLLLTICASFYGVKQGKVFCVSDLKYYWISIFGPLLLFLFWLLYILKKHHIKF